MNSPSPGSLDTLRRAKDDTMVFGVARGIANNWRIDPTLVRIGFIIAVFLGGAGLVMYVAVAALVPAEGEDRGWLGRTLGLNENEERFRSLGLLTAAGIALLSGISDIFFDGSFWRFTPAFVLLWLAVPIGALYWFLVVRRNNSAADPSPSPTGPLSTPTYQIGTTIMEKEDTMSMTGEQAPPPPPVEPRTPWNPTLTVLTAAAIAIAGGIIWWFNLEGADLGWDVFVAVALGITALGLFVGAFAGDGGGLIALGIVLALALPLATVFPGGKYELISSANVGSVTVRPTSAASIPNDIDHGVGKIIIDLRRVEPEALQNRTINANLGIGQITVLIPEGLPVSIEANTTLGEVEIFSDRSDGVDAEIVTGRPSHEALNLFLETSVGSIKVEKS